MSKEENGLKPSYAVVLFAIVILNILWLTCSSWTAVKIEGNMPLYQIVNIIMLAVSAYYAFYGYKKPHGNHVRYLLLCSAVFSAVKFVVDDIVYPGLITFIYFLIIILTVYMAGRLDRYKQNVIISAVVLICECSIVYYIVNDLISTGMPISFVTFIACLGPVVLWIDMAGAYIFRYKLHKEAGFEDNK